MELLVATPQPLPPLRRPSQTKFCRCCGPTTKAWPRFHLLRIGLFGSVGCGEATPGSDVDLWVELDPLTPYATVHLKQELEQLLQRPVDLVRLRERTNPALRQMILREVVSS